MDSEARQTIKGYELRERVGAGGSGEVYRAYQPAVGREVAIKVILPRHAAEPAFIRRFEVEAQLVARLEHPHIVPLYDYWRDPTGAYLVMRSLRSNLRAALAHEPWKLEAAARLLDQIAAALTFAHREGIVHRDIKPENILLDEDDNAYLSDFGIAKDIYLRIPTEDAAYGAALRSAAYVSPEQIRQETVGERSDLYSLGCVLYEVLTGRKPYPDATTPEDYLERHLHTPLPTISLEDARIPAAVDEVLQTATAKNPSHRYPNATRFAAAFRAAVPSHLPRLPAQPLPEPLTERELDVLRLLTDGRSNGEIAERLVLSAQTVKWYVRQVYGKLDVHSRQQAAVRATNLRLFEPPSAVYEAPSASEAGAASRISLAVVAPENPYKGLRAFQETDAADFFGRAALTERLLSRLSDADENARFLVVVGPSGSGKSSLVRAGLIPALRHGALAASPHPFITDLLPGTHPLEELEAALLRVAANPLPGLLDQLRGDRRGLARAAKRVLPNDRETELILVIDQFEEVFTLVQDETVRMHFIDNLLSAVSDPRGRVRVVMTLRADFYDRPLLYPRLAELVRTNTEVIVPLSARELEQAILAPAERVGMRLEAGLAATILDDVSEQPGALPLLQYALRELFERREELTLTLDAYRASGGVLGALTRRADAICDSLDARTQGLAQQVFLRLVTLGEGTEDTRRRTLLSELTALDGESAVEDVINAFVDYRLLTLDRDPLTHAPTVEMAHEALIREWGRLREWLEQSRQDIRMQRRLAQAAGDWNGGEDASYLASGLRLEQFEVWARETPLALSSAERSYLDACLEERTRAERLEGERQRRERRLEQRSRAVLRALVAVFAVAAVVAIGLSVLALNLSSQATHSAQQFRSTALAIGARQALDDGKPDVALALAQEAVNMSNPPLEFQLTFFEAATSTWIRQRYVGGHTTSMRDAAFLPDGERMVTVGWDGRAVLWNVATGEPLKSIQNDGRIVAVAAHPGGHLVALGAEFGRFILWNVDNDDVTYLETDQSGARAPLFSHDGALFVGAGQDGKVFVWDIATHALIRSFQASEIAVLGLDLSPDESLLLTASQDGSARIWDFATTELIQTLEHPAREHTQGAAPWVWKALFLPDGERVITGDTSGVVRLWDWRSGDDDVDGVQSW